MKSKTDIVDTTINSAIATAIALELQKQRDAADVETLRREGRPVEEEQDCTHCKLREICSDTDGKKRMSSVCEADFW